jgi:hypothetical protein
MTTLELAENRVTMRKVGSEWHGPCPACGAGKSGASHTDRFSVKADGRWFCRVCTPEGGDAVKFLRSFDGLSCPEAHSALGKACTSTTCPVRDKCRMGEKSASAPSPRRLAPPQPVAAPAFVPAAVIPPAEQWAIQAEKLVAAAHAALLENPGQLAYLAGRGIPLGAVVKNRLGWIAEDLYRPRTVWGLPEETWSDGKPKKLKLHSGLLIPTFVDGLVHRLRIRRPKETLKENEPGYLEVKGSGNDRIITNPQARAVVIVESDLDALLIDWVAGDLVGAMPVVSATAKPKASTWDQLSQALCLLVSTDYEPSWSDEKKQWTNVGGKASLWWQQQFPRALRWPVPAGKDPGEYFSDHSGDLRAWILAGLPPVFHLPAPAATVEAPVDIEVESKQQVDLDIDPEKAFHGTWLSGVAALGRFYIVADDPRDLVPLAADYPDHGVFRRSEMSRLQGLTPEALDAIILWRIVVPGGTVVKSGPAGPDPASISPAKTYRHPIRPQGPAASAVK